MAKTKVVRGTCSLDGCNEPHKAAGYCNTHYTQFRKGVAPYLVIKRQMEKPESCSVEGCDAPVKSKGLCHKHYARKLRHGHTKYHDRKKPPKSCSVDGCSNWLYAKNLCHQHYEKAKSLKKKYGITVEQYDAMLQQQGGKCAICDGDQKRKNFLSGKEDDMPVDHCHETGKVRGLLCDKCNRGIGLLNDSPELLRAAAAYIERHRCDKTA